MRRRACHCVGNGLGVASVAVSFITLLILSLGASAQQLRLRPSEEHETESVVRELLKQREDRSAELRRIDAQIERVRGAKGGFAAPLRVDDVRARIVNGVMTVSFPTVGALLHSYLGPDGTYRLTTWCTGTLIGSQTFITAAHCISDDLTPGKYRVFFQHAGLFGVSSVVYQNALYRFPKADVAIIKLESPVDGIRVQPVTDEAVTTPGLLGVIVGYGRTGGNTATYGIKRTGYVKTSKCSCATAATCLESGEQICWVFDALISNPGMDSNTCNADSGGPLLLEKVQGEAMRLVGTTSGGTRVDCLSHDESYDLAVFKYRDWITQQAGADMGVSAPGPLVGEAGVAVQAAGGRFDEQTRKLTYGVTIGPGAKRLVVAMNADDTLYGDNRFRLELRAPGDGATPRCAVRDAVQFKACAISDPPPGEWSVAVIAERGGGDFQLVSTTFSR